MGEGFGLAVSQPDTSYGVHAGMLDAFDQLIRDVSRLSASAVVGVIDDEENAKHLDWSERGTPTSEPRPMLRARYVFPFACA